MEKARLMAILSPSDIGISNLAYLQCAALGHDPDGSVNRLAELSDLLADAADSGCWTLAAQ